MSTVIDLGRLSRLGFALHDDARSHAGAAVAASDVNGDGFTDLIVGAPGGDYKTYTAGSAYVVFGKAGGITEVEGTSLGELADVVIHGMEPYDQVGRSVSSAGDVNGDGFEDFIVGAWPLWEEGEAYVIFGRSDEYGFVNLSNLDPGLGFLIKGGSSSSGFSISSAGDFNGDGYGDVIVGSPSGDAGGDNSGQAYVIFGKPGDFSTINLDALNSGTGFALVGSEGDGAGISVSLAGDVNGDGLDDLIIGASQADGGMSKAGEAYIVFGKTDPSETVILSALPPTQGLVIQGANSYEFAGNRVSGAGDVNGDGFDDFIVSSQGENAYVIFGSGALPTSLSLADMQPEDGFIISAGSSQDIRSVASAGDVDGDGYDDIMIGVPEAGGTYVIFGKSAGFEAIQLDSLDPEDGFKIQRGGTGGSVSSAGDINGDGYDDLIVGAPDGTNRASGSVYVVFGGEHFRPVIATGSAAQDTLNGGIADDQLSGGGGDDHLEGWHGSDVLDGGEGVDVATYRLADRGVIIDLNTAGPQDTVGAGLDLLVSIEGLSGSLFDDVLTGTDTADILAGIAGNDLLSGAGGNDILDGGDGVDTADYRSATGSVTAILKINGPQNTGSAGMDTLVGIENIRGSEFDDLLEGDTGDNVLDGGNGNDRLRGNEGDDALNGGLGTDLATFAGAASGVTVRLYYNKAQDTGEGFDQFSSVENVFGSAFSDRLLGSVSDNVLNGGAGDDQLAGGYGKDSLLGGDGHDQLEGGDGADEMRGGNGDDVYLVDSQDVVLEGQGAGNDTVRSSLDYIIAANIENLTLTGTAVRGTGNGLANALVGNSSANILDGAAGADSMRGGGGNDVYHADNSGDRALEALNDGTDLVFSSVSFRLGENVENLALTGMALSGTGNGLANSITGNVAANRLDGGSGADTLRGGAGDDVYYVDIGSDRAIEGASAGYDTVRSSVSYTIGANVEQLILTGTASANGTGNSGANRISGTGGDNRISGLGGTDSLLGLSGDDRMLGGDGSDSLDGGAGYDILSGEAGNDELIGQAGNDTLNGGSGNDLIRGGAGRDHLTGGSGLDRFYFETGLRSPDNLDTIADFAVADDTIMLDRVVFAAIGSDGLLSAAGFRLGTSAGDSADRIIYNSANGLIYYDADGLGGEAQVAFARVTAGTSLTRADFSAYSSAAAASAAQAPAPLFEDEPREPFTPARPMPEFWPTAPDHHIV